VESERDVNEQMTAPQAVNPANLELSHSGDGT